MHRSLNEPLGARLTLGEVQWLELLMRAAGSP